MAEVYAVNSDYYISVQSGDVVIVCGCESVLAYEDERIVLKLKKKNVTVSGENLSMASYFGNEIKICGRIGSISFGV